MIGRVLTVCLLLAGSAPAAEDGGQPAAWTKLALGARSAALGQAVSALPDDAGAALLNPALAAAQARAELGSQLAYLPDGRQLHYLGLARPFWQDSSFAWSLGYAQYAVPEEFERRKGNTGTPDGKFRESASSTQLGLAAWAWKRQVSVGFNVKVLSHALGDASGGGVAGDLGLYWRSLDWLDLGLSARDLFSQLGWSSESKERLPLRLRLGARGHLLGERLQLLAELEQSALQATRTRLGLEAWPWAQVLALRAGFDGAGWAAGLGLRWPWRTLGLGFDYALAADPLGADALQHRVSLELSVPL